MNSIVVRGTLNDSRHIELAEPVHGITGVVEVTIRGVPSGPKRDVFEIIGSVAAGARAKADIDNDIRESRDQWAQR